MQTTIKQLAASFTASTSILTFLPHTTSSEKEAIISFMAALIVQVMIKGAKEFSLFRERRKRIRRRKTHTV